MNWLAHILLSKKDIEYQLGNFLADPLKGKVWEGASESVENGMLMHKSIDIFTDSHKIVSQSKSRLGSKGYLKGVIIDILYDHYLASNWSDYSNISLSRFLNSFKSEGLVASKVFPDEPKHIVARLVESDRLAKYNEFEGFIEAIYRINDRLSPRIKAKDSALNYIEVVEHEYEPLKEDFAEFLPELMTYFRNHELGSETDNYLALV